MLNQPWCFHLSANKRGLSLVALLLCIWMHGNLTYAQSSSITVEGRVTESDGSPIPECQIIVKKALIDKTDQNGRYKFSLPVTENSVEVTFRHVGFDTYKWTLKLSEGITRYEFNPVLKSKVSEQAEVEVVATDKFRDNVSTIELKSKDIKTLPSAFGDFNMILATLPGVISNNELSSQYAVRGGNFDENLVYVNDMEIYRPFLVRAGQQEGLSFVNPDLVKNVEFSSGGWQPRFGDKLSSVLNVEYKTPTKFGGSITAGILNQAAHLEGTGLNSRLSWVAGVRRKSSQYLLQGLPVSGEYLPNFVDGQAFLNYNLTTAADSAKGAKSSISLLASFARNDYLVRPKDRETEFGTLSSTLRIYMAFIGQEKLFYDTWQGGLKFSRTFNPKFRTDVTISAVRTQERERIDVEGGYRLCDVQKDPSKDNFNECIFERGVGTFYQYGRNDLDALIVNLLTRSYYKISQQSQLEFGINVTQEQVADRLDEYNFVDSSDFVKVSPYIFAENSTINTKVGGYVQHSWYPTNTITVTYGLRYLYTSLNKQHLFSPRFQASYKPEWTKDFLFKFSAGVYHQPAFYREMRNSVGQVNTGLLAQSSAHFIIGSDYNLKINKRPFKLTAEAYYKSLWNLVPYDVDNVRLRYFGTNNATGYAMGADLRFSGEFINGAESWVSLGLLSTKELIEGNPAGYTRRPTDQMVTAAVFFQDHLPNAPSARVYLNAIFGTGLPFGPPNNIAQRGALTAPFYRRVDVGFSKIYVLDRNTRTGKVFDNIWIGLEVLNLLGVDNVISYTWVKDVANTQFAIPNTLSTRFFNLRVIGTLK